MMIKSPTKTAADHSWQQTMLNLAQICLHFFRKALLYSELQVGGVSHL